jgi:integrase
VLFQNLFRITRKRNLSFLSCHAEFIRFVSERALAYKTQNRRIKKIHLHSFRHWKATITYHKTKDILYVKKILGHKSINSTLLYTQLISFEVDEFNVKVAETKMEIVKLLEAGFEWIGKDNDGLTYFRKRK